jgi:hypothetical protein
VHEEREEREAAAVEEEEEEEEEGQSSCSHNSTAHCGSDTSRLQPREAFFPGRPPPAPPPPPPDEALWLVAWSSTEPAE